MHCLVSDVRGTVIATVPTPLMDPANVGVLSENISFEVNYIVVFTR